MPVEVTFTGTAAVESTGGITPASTTVATTSSAPSAPPNASAAPTQSVTIQGLCQALNQWQQGLVQAGTYSIADQYEVVFVPANMANSTLKKPGSTADSNTALQDPTTAKDKVDPTTNSVKNNTRTISVQQGKQIVAFIEETMRNSSYISNQLTTQVNEVTQQDTPNANNTNGDSSWFKVSVQVQNLGYDKARRDTAYKMTFIISPYAINEMRSAYMPNAKFKGVHKLYQYWFTGQNTEILRYEQTLNNSYYTVMSNSQGGGSTGGINNINNNTGATPSSVFNSTDTGSTDGRTSTSGPGGAISDTADSKISYKRSWATRSGETDQGGAGAVNEPAANAADSMYNAVDFQEVDLTIIGDPAWLPQGEVSGTLGPGNFSTSQFLNDGTINFDSGQAVFRITFKQPTDYDFNKGIVDVSNLTIETATYRATQLRSRFSKGRFEQDLRGTLILGADQNSTATPFNTAVSAKGLVDPKGLTQTINEAVGITRAGSSAARKGNNLLNSYNQTIAPLVVGSSGNTNTPTTAGGVTNVPPQPAGTPTPPSTNGTANATPRSVVFVNNTTGAAPPNAGDIAIGNFVNVNTSPSRITPAQAQTLIDTTIPRPNPAVITQTMAKDS